MENMANTTNAAAKAKWLTSDRNGFPEGARRVVGCRPDIDADKFVMVSASVFK
jgi:hypothetical protein